MAEARRIPKVGMSVVFRPAVDATDMTDLQPALVSATHNKHTEDGKVTRVPMAEGVIEVTAFHQGRAVVQTAKYAKGAEYSQSWCWPEEVG